MSRGAIGVRRWQRERHANLERAASRPPEPSAPLRRGDRVRWGEPPAHVGVVRDVRADGLIEVEETAVAGRTWRLAAAALTRR